MAEILGVGFHFHVSTWVCRYYCLEQHVFCSILFCYNGFKTRSQIIWHSSHRVSLGSLSPLLNLCRFLTALTHEILCATSGGKVIKNHWAFALLSGHIFYWSPTLPITLRPPCLEEAQRACIVHTWNVWLSVSGESNFWVIVFQALDMYMKSPASSTPP